MHDIKCDFFIKQVFFLWLKILKKLIQKKKCNKSHFEVFDTFECDNFLKKNFFVDLGPIQLLVKKLGPKKCVPDLKNLKISFA